MSIFWQFIPTLLFVLVFTGSGAYFSAIGRENAFSLLPPIVAIIPSLILAWIKNRKKSDEKTADFLGGVGHKDIMFMCMVFVLAGAFGEVTRQIGCVESVIDLVTSLVPTRFLLIGIFMLSALISLSIGSAVGTIASIGPLAAELCQHTNGLEAPLAMGVVVGGAFFGDNMSLISDTTVAAISSQGADIHKKLKINMRIASFAIVITLLILWLKAADTSADMCCRDFSLLQPAPYIIILLLAFCRVNVLVCLMTGIAIAGLIGCILHTDYGIIEFSRNIDEGFKNVSDTVLLAMMIGGLSGLVGNDAIKEVGRRIASHMATRDKGTSRLPQFVIGALAAISTAFFANNVIAIIFCGPTAKEIAKRNGVSPHYAATILEVFACGVKGLLPYGVQVLLAASIAGISPFSILPHIHYCYVLMIVTIAFVWIKDKRDPALN